MLPPIHPKTGIKITKLAGIKPANGVYNTSSNESEVYSGLVIIDDDNASTSQIFTEYGIERKSGYVVYLEPEAPILKKDTENLRVYFSETKMHNNSNYSASDPNQIKLVVKAIARKNAVYLSHIMLLCDVS